MSSIALDATTVTVNASAAATAWLNAFLATGDDVNRPVLYRTLAVELFDDGVQFIATDATMIFRTWVPAQDTDAEWPSNRRPPRRAVVVLDGDHFALAFIRATLAASKMLESAELSLTVESAPEQAGTPPLGSSFSEEVLTLRAFGQQLHCRLYDDKFVNWRGLKLGDDHAERVDGMTLAAWMFATVGKLRAISEIECTFTGENRRITLRGDRSFRGLLMPMLRPPRKAPKEENVDEAQLDALEMEGKGAIENTKVKVDGEWVPATPENLARALRPRKGGRDHAVGRDG